MTEKSIGKPSKIVWANMPGTACNLSCEYCYARAGKGVRGRFPHDVDSILSALRPERFGGPLMFGGASGGETLLCDGIVEFTQGMLEMGHVVSYTTNMTHTPAIRRLCSMPTGLRARLELDASLHYAELKQKGMLDTYFANLRECRESGVSIAMFICISHDYLPYLHEISERCMSEIGLLPVAGMVRDYDRSGGTNSAVYSEEIDRLVHETCDARQWDLQKRVYGQKRTETCHVGEYAINLDMNTGQYRQCWQSPVIGNLFESSDSTVEFRPLGSCPFHDCVCASYQCWGFIPELGFPTHSQTYFTEESVSPEIYEFMDTHMTASAPTEPQAGSADWDALWSAGFEYGPLDGWARDIFMAIAELLKDRPDARILSAGCGRGLVDYWLIKTFGYHVTFLDSSRRCIENLRTSLSDLDPEAYALSHASIFDMPFEDGTFDLVWNEGVLEHFSDDDYIAALREMARVSSGHVLVDVPNANCRPYVLTKRWLEDHSMWSWGYESPKATLSDAFREVGLQPVVEKSIGSRRTIDNYLDMVPAAHRAEVTDLLRDEDYGVYPHLLCIGLHAGGYPHLQKAEEFLTQCVRGGLANSLDTATGAWVKPYPEVTGYLLSYFAETAEDRPIPPVILGAASTLVGMQSASGGFRTFYGDELYTFDTAQIMHGLVSVYRRTGREEYLAAALNCARFVSGMQLPDGSMYPIYHESTGTKVADPEGNWGIAFSHIQVKAAEGLLALYEVTGVEALKRVAERLVAWGKEHCDLSHTHPGAYCLEGLLAAGEIEFVREQLRSSVIPRIRPNGFIPYAEGLPYAYVSGSVQMAILLWKTGFADHALRILGWARRVQRNHGSGGLFQYADEASRLDASIHSEVNSWGTKYFAQLERLVQEAPGSERRAASPYEWTQVSQAFYDVVGNLVSPGFRILEMGSSTGHISFRLAQDALDVRLLDIRPEAIAEAERRFGEGGVTASFTVGDFLTHGGAYDLVWNSGLLQCFDDDRKSDFIHHASRLSGRFLAFYPDTDSPGKVRGSDADAIPGVGDAMEYSVREIPELFGEEFDLVINGRIRADETGLPFDMLWTYGQSPRR